MLELVGEREADRERQSVGDDCAAAVEPGSYIEKMHRPSASAAAPFLLAVHLGHDRPSAHAAHERVPMLAVCRDDCVVRPECLHHADRHGLLTDVQVEEAADLLLFIEIGAALLEAANAKHLVEQM